MLEQLVEFAKKNIVNSVGFKTGRKIVVFESDDWGAIRMSSKENLEKLARAGINVEKSNYLMNDALASEEDLRALFEILARHKDSKGRPPVITANTIMANPDFGKIKESDFTEYHYELFTKTLKRYPEHEHSFQLWKQGMQEGLFHPQFHGREHLQVLRWLYFLKHDFADTIKAFNLGVYGLGAKIASQQSRGCLAAYDWDDAKSHDFVLQAVSDGLNLFEQIFGFRSLSSIAPNYTWHPELEQTFRTHGVKYFQGTRVQRSPEINKTRNLSRIRHFTGQRNGLGQRYLVRNAKFEPSSNPAVDWVDQCLKDIRNAFLWGKPAIIEMHRVNFIGFIHPANRDDNLQLLDSLLRQIKVRYPDVEFMTSDQLGNLITNNS